MVYNTSRNIPDHTTDRRLYTRKKMKKYIIWVPVVGFFFGITEGVKAFCNKPSWFDNDNVLIILANSIFHGVSMAILFTVIFKH